MLEANTVNYLKIFPASKKKNTYISEGRRNGTPQKVIARQFS